MSPDQSPLGNVSIRTEPRAEDFGAIVRLHREVYARERGFDITFESYVEGPLSEFLHGLGHRERLWVAERDGRMVGCIAIVSVSPETAQLRWFLVDPSARGVGLGRHLLDAAVSFSKMCGYDTLILWTESALTTAARLYTAAGFVKTEEKPGQLWGMDLVEEKYELNLH